MEIKDIKTTIQSADITKLRIREKLLELYPNTISKLDLLIKEAIENAQVTCQITTTNENELTLIKILLDQGNYFLYKMGRWFNKFFLVSTYIKAENRVKKKKKAPSKR